MLTDTYNQQKREEGINEPFLLVALYLEGAQLNNVEDEPETMGAGESREWSFASLGQLQASLGSSLLHQGINDWEECISHPKEQNYVSFKYC